MRHSIVAQPRQVPEQPVKGCSLNFSDALATICTCTHHVKSYAFMHVLFRLLSYKGLCMLGSVFKLNSCKCRLPVRQVASFSGLLLTYVHCLYRLGCFLQEAGLALNTPQHA